MNLPARPDDVIFPEHRQVDHRGSQAALVCDWSTVHHHRQFGPKLLELLQKNKPGSSEDKDRIKLKRNILPTRSLMLGNIETCYERKSISLLTSCIVSTYLYFQSAAVCADVGTGERQWFPTHLAETPHEGVVGDTHANKLRDNWYLLIHNLVTYFSLDPLMGVNLLRWRGWDPCWVFQIFQTPEWRGRAAGQLTAPPSRSPYRTWGHTETGSSRVVEFGIAKTDLSVDSSPSTKPHNGPSSASSSHLLVDVLNFSDADGQRLVSVPPLDVVRFSDCVGVLGQTGQAIDGVCWHGNNVALLQGLRRAPQDVSAICRAKVTRVNEATPTVQRSVMRQSGTGNTALQL